MKTVRIILSILFLLVAVLMIAVALTAPAIVAAAPAILALFAALIGWLCWPRKPKVVYVRESEIKQA